MQKASEERERERERERDTDIKKGSKTGARKKRGVSLKKRNVFFLSFFLLS
jgi:hypothetical protein